MADSLNIPGVTDKYGTNAVVEALINAEKVPLERAKKNLENYQNQQDAWRDVNRKMSSLRDNVKTLYSFDNPFNNKLASSSNEDAITVTAGREADYGTIKIDVIQPATTDRFLSDSISKDFIVKQGKYTFTVGEKTIDFNWKGGKVTDFVTALNRRGGETIKASLIGINSKEKALLVESLKEGEENKLVLKNQALELGKEIGLVTIVKPEVRNLKFSPEQIKEVRTRDAFIQDGMPELSKAGVKSTGKEIILDPRSGFELSLGDAAKNESNNTVEFTFSLSETKDITEELNESNGTPDLPSPGSIFYKGVSVSNNPSETSLPDAPVERTEQLFPILDTNHFYIKDDQGKEIIVNSGNFTRDKDGKTKVAINLSDYPNAKSLVIRNGNTGKILSLTVPEYYRQDANLGFTANHPVSTAKDAKIKYEGITMSRPTNDIDDVIPHLTLHLHEATEKTATIKIEPDTESAKDALIGFVGRYNQTIAEMTVLSSNKPEVIAELDYLTDDERETFKERLGMFQGDFSLTNGKSSLQRIVTGSYRYSEDQSLSLLSQIGISTHASGGGGYSASQMRGYLEVDEKKLDEALENNLDSIKNLFGYDTDGDLIIDSGIGYTLDRTLTSWVQSGGIISSKTNALETQIKNSNQQIAKLQTQLDQKEAQLRAKYGTMQGTLNSLESQQKSLENFSKQGSNR